ncbi:MBL fold metallo-hydrolase [Rhodococcus sp. NPDC127530]|uniref:MBL fold metallo-hydrolase n=1 Tax=unclassified Rhodococcus (in: high G+C Gram-positive bacteria) TaxID=192944 RepID=UPI0036265513
MSTFPPPLLQLGELRIDRVEEFCAPVLPAHDFLTDLPADAIDRQREWLTPRFFDDDTGLLVISDHTWVVRTPRATILIDTCWGNDKPRPGFGGNLDTPWLGLLAELGVAPEDVDVVVCTHLHSDHVGWNTRLVDGQWVPTFPRARYVLPRAEFEYWQGAENSDFGHDAAFADSVLPCVEAGLVELVEPGHTIDGCLTLEAAPGHTTGQVIVRAESQGERAVFAADVLHVPLQLAYPDSNSIACDDPELARQTRRRLLEKCAQSGDLLISNHFPAPFFGFIERAGDAFALTDTAQKPLR